MCYKYKIKAKNTFLNGWWPEDTSMSNTWKKTKDSMDNGPKMSTKGAVKKTIINTKSKIWYNP